MTIPIPAELMAAAAQHRRAHLPRCWSIPALVTPGEIAIAQAGTLRSHVIVRDVHEHEGRRYANVTICDNIIEMATDLDLIVPGHVNRPYRLVAYAELYAQVWDDQLVEHLGMLTDAELEGLRGALATDGESLDDLEHGLLPLAGPFDGRWQYRHKMLYEVVMPLREDCLRTLWDAL